MNSVISKEKRYDLDEIDVQIISKLSENASITGTELAEIIGLSIPATNKRIAKLVDSGIIKKWTIVLDEKKIGKPMLAFMLVVMDSLSSFDKFMEYMDNEKDVLECVATTGDFDYIVKICAKDIDDLEDKITSIKKIKGVVKTHTMIGLAIHKPLTGVLPDEIK